MQIEATRRRFTVGEYYRMGETGVLGPEDRTELLEGEIFQMSGIRPRHLGCTNRINDAFTAAFRGRAVVSPQHPVRLDDYSEPQPDLALLAMREDFYSSKTPQAADAVLVVEVSDTTLHFDSDVKLPLYAAARVPEVWIADLEAGVLRVFREPAGRRYAVEQVLGPQDSASVAAFPDATFRVGDLLG
jgi:Putative restriction endonuclease